MMNQLPQKVSHEKEVIDGALDAVGFELDHVSPQKVSGHLIVTPKCCQPLKKLHGGVSALIAEALGSMGAFYASEGQFVTGFQLAMNHLKSAEIGDYVVAEATPVSVGKTIQVWETSIWKSDPPNSMSHNKTLISTGRVTVHCQSLSEKSVKENIEKTKSNWLAKL